MRLRGTTHGWLVLPQPAVVCPCNVEVLSPPAFAPYNLRLAVPAAAHRHSRSMAQQRGAGGGSSLFPTAQERHLAELPLAELIAAEEEACAAEQEERDREEREREEPRRGRRGGDAGGGVGAAGGAGARTQGVYVDRAVIIPPPSPPGQMAGHRPAPAAATGA